MLPKPCLVVIAGPNGSGKTTIVSQFNTDPQAPENYVNADDIAKQYPMSSLDAANTADRHRNKLLSNRFSFTTETVLSTHRKIDLMKQAKQLGYEIGLIYVTTQSPDINVSRVANRVAFGGHDVSEDKIRARY